MKNIILTGFMASGKTTIGKALSEQLKMDFIDTDEMIEKEQGITITEIFAQFGEEYFRNLEHKCAKKLSSCKKSVIATGGGFVLGKENIELLRKNGIIINLNTNEQIIRKRLENSKSTRPLLKDDFEKILLRFEKRKPLYDICDIQINLDEASTPSEHVNRIVKEYNNHLQKGVINK